VEKAQDGGVSKLKLALGAASLFLFVVGLKRSFRKDDGSEVLSTEEPAVPGREGDGPRERARFRNTG
jgi:hypothetical protein